MDQLTRPYGSEICITEFNFCLIWFRTDIEPDLNRKVDKKVHRFHLFDRHTWRNQFSQPLFQPKNDKIERMFWIVLIIYIFFDFFQQFNTFLSHFESTLNRIIT